MTALEETTGGESAASRCTPCLVANAIGVLLVVGYIVRRFQR